MWCGRGVCLHLQGEVPALSPGQGPPVLEEGVRGAAGPMGSLGVPTRGTGPEAGLPEAPAFPRGHGRGPGRPLFGKAPSSPLTAALAGWGPRSCCGLGLGAVSANSQWALSVGHLRGLPLAPVPVPCCAAWAPSAVPGQASQCCGIPGCGCSGVPGSGQGGEGAGSVNNDRPEQTQNHLPQPPAPASVSAESACQAPLPMGSRTPCSHHRGAAEDHRLLVSG